MDYNRVVSNAERRYGLQPGLLASVWQQESGGSTDLGLQGEQLSRGRGAAVGPFQIVPYYHPTADLGSFESQADYAAKYLKEAGVEGYYGTGQAPAGHPTTEQYKQQVMSRVQQQPPQAQPQGGAPMQGPPMVNPGFSLPSSQPLDLSPIEVDETPSFASAMASNPFLMMGLGILGSGDIGKGAMQGLLAASQAETSATKRNEFKIDQEYKRRQQQIWENQNRVAEQKMWGAGVMSPAERARNEQSMRTHERALTEQQQSRTTNPEMMQLADGTTAPVVYDKRTGTMRQVTESGMGEPVQVVGPAPKAGAGGAGTKKDKDLAKVENAQANLDILEAMAFGDGQTPGIFQGRQRGAEGRITSLIGDTREALTGDDPRHKAYNDFSGGTMASIVKGLGDTGSIAVAEQERAKALLPKLGWDGDTTESARLKMDMLRTLLGNWKARGEAIKNGQEPPPPLTVAEVQAQRAGQAPPPMSAMPPQANPGAGGMLPGGTQALPGGPQAMPPQAGGARRFIYNPNTGKLEAR